MSAPTPAPGDETPREGYYPDPSIPGYVRYWNGASWVPGTSRPAPTDGALLHTPEPTAPAAPAAPGPAAAPPVEETGPVFFDEEEPPRSELAPPASPHGNRPAPAASWGASPGLQSGFGGDQDRKVSWGAPSVPDPRASTAPAAPPAPATGSAPPAAPAAPNFPDAAGREGAGPDAPVRGEAARGVPGDHGTMTFHRAPRTHAPPGTPTSPAPAPPGPVPHQQGPVRLPPQSTPAAPAPAPAVPAQSSAPPTAPAPALPAPALPAPALPAPAAPAAGPPAPAAPLAPAAPVQHGTPELPAQVAPAPGTGQPSWAQQVHRLAQSAPAAPAAPTPADDGRGEGPVIPFKPPVSDPFLAVAQAQAAARPAGLGRRLLARLVDTAVLVAVTGAAAVPLGIRAADHVDEKIEAAKLSGRTVTVWLVDGTTAGYLGAVVAVLLLTGIVYEVLPTAKWGRTAGKRLFGLRVQDIGAHEAPSFGAALRRFLVLTVPGLLAVGALGVLWAVFDRPWRQGWHDKAARTFVAR
ncbi:RDD family protein [Streptomyces sp. NPDC058171]